jgi:hypothetical protein
MSDSYRNARNWKRPEVVRPTRDSTQPGTRTRVSRSDDQVAAIREQLRASGLNDAALNALEAGNEGIDKGRKA